MEKLISVKAFALLAGVKNKTIYNLIEEEVIVPVIKKNRKSNQRGTMFIDCIKYKPKKYKHSAGRPTAESII